MTTLTIDDVPEKVVRVLKRRAEIERKSMEDVAREMLEREAVDRAEVLASIKELSERQTRPTTPEEIDEWKRFGRE